MTREAQGALIEYGSNFLGPLPNVVVFQFNVEELNRQFALQHPAPLEEAP